jgi:hypothetical protein
MGHKNGGIELTEAEQTAHEAAQLAAQANEQAIADAKTALEANRASGKAKLKAGEALNDDEISALFRYE